MPGSKYRLTYLPIKGRGELIRLIFHAARVPFEDRRIAFADIAEFKKKNPTASIPMLEINGEQFGESAAIANWAARKFGLMGKTDAEELKTEAIVIQATDLREKFVIPLFLEKDPEKIEELKKELEAAVDKVFTMWEACVVQTESNGRKIFSYMVTQSMTVADLAVVYVADLMEPFISVDWTCFPRLHAVIKTVSDLPHLRAYLTNRDNPDNVSNSLVTSRSTPRSQPTTSRAEVTPKQHPSSRSVDKTPRGKPTPRQAPVKQKA